MNREQLKTVSDALHNGAEPGEVWAALKLPLKAVPAVAKGCGVIVEAGGENALYNGLALEKAQEIVRRCNAHDELVAVIKATLPRFCELLNYRERYEGKAWAQDFYEVQTKLRAVIANAEKSL